MMRCRRSRLCPPVWVSGKIKLIALLLAAGIAVATLSACGSGGGGASGGGAAEAVAALDLPSRVTLSSAEGTSNSASAIRGSSIRKLARQARLNVFNDAGTDYSNETKVSWLKDTDALDTVNDILGVVTQSGYDNFINAGPYKALVQKVGDSETSQSGTTSTSTTTEELMEIILDVTRASNTAPMIIKVWVKEDDGPGGATMMIRGYFEVSEGVSADYPYGIMSAHFKGSQLDANGDEVAGDPLFTMAMSIGAAGGNVIVEQLEQGSEDGGGPVNFEWDRRVRLVANSTLSAGNAYVYNAETNDQTGLLDAETLYFAYNGDFFKYQDAASLVTTTQDKNNLVHRIHKYKLFREDTGAKVTRSSGFPIRTAGGQYGYVGYYGLWLPYGNSAVDGDTVTRVDNDQTYTLIKKGGKLVRHTRSQTTLGALDGLEVSVWDQTNGRDIIVTWNGAAGAFYKTGERSSSTGQIQYLTEENYTVYTFANAWEGGWCQALSAHLPLGLIEAPTDATVIYYHSQETVSGAQASDLTLYYWGFAMTAPVTQGGVDSANTDEMTYRSTSPVRKTYTFDAADLVLKDGSGNAMLFSDGIDLSGTIYGGGCTLMHLTTDDTYTAGTSYDIGNAETYYSWTFGSNPYNLFTALREAGGATVSFDPPLNFAYTHTQANDVNADATYAGKLFSLSYDGSSLNLPWIFDETSGEWAPTFNLKDATVLVDSGSNRYVVKAVEEALLMSTTSDPAADALVIDTTIPAPTLTYDSTKTDLVGAVPTDAELMIIKGELIE